MAAILNFPTKKWTKKMETVFFQSFRVNISEKSQLFKIYMKKSQNDTMPYTNRRFLVLPSFTPKTMRSLSRLSCKQSQKLHVFRRFFSAATYVSVVSSKCCARVLNLYRSNVSLVCPKMWPSILPMMIAIVSVSAGRKRCRPVVLRYPSSK